MSVGRQLQLSPVSSDSVEHVYKLNNEIIPEISVGDDVEQILSTTDHFNIRLDFFPPISRQFFWRVGGAPLLQR